MTLIQSRDTKVAFTIYQSKQRKVMVVLSVEFTNECAKERYSFLLTSTGRSASVSVSEERLPSFREEVEVYSTIPACLVRVF